MAATDILSFGVNQLDRAAHFRSDPEKLLGLQADGVFLPLWRGKPLVHPEDGGGLRLVLVEQTHPLVANCNDSPVFLGLSGDQPVFAVTLPDWEGIALPDTNSFLDTQEQSHPEAPAGSVFKELRTMLTALTPPQAEIAATARAIHEWHRSHRFCSCCGQPSLSAQAGWQRDCPSCGRMHFPRTDPVVIMLITHGNRVLIGRSPGWPEGMYSLLAGFMEPGETIEAATRREVFEETGVRVGKVGYLASQPWPFPASLMIGTRGEALSDTITLDPNELEDALWLTREEAMQSFAGHHPAIRPARPGSIAHFLLRNWLADHTV
ncbi:NAD(+) diphosphatase [Aliiroseovarius crassostreae]|uniref:NAD(+) diphosphatase n=1 Tax=Aliiroseovarius crassostreae TaxID=154981 RepID=A0A9Q9HCN8_9RHOB|nr:NAD(+) diphosphatase [Aliiroseovarius crassostreae]UWP94837.1 NAD(+) diphosphatase [Aliiroseovarius crassostreae]